MPYFNCLQQVSGHSARLRTLSLSPRGQICQLHHQLLHSLTHCQQLLSVWPWQRVRQSTALSYQSPYGSLACRQRDNRLPFRLVHLDNVMGSVYIKQNVCNLIMKCVISSRKDQTGFPNTPDSSLPQFGQTDSLLREINCLQLMHETHFKFKQKQKSYQKHYTETFHVSRQTESYLFPMESSTGVQVICVCGIFSSDLSLKCV